VSFKPSPRRVILTVIFILLSFLYVRREEGLPFKVEWIWHDQPVYHSSSPIMHRGFPWSYLTEGEFQVTQEYKSGFAFLGCDSKACVFDVSGQKRVFLYYFNVLLNLIFWYFIAWLAIFIFGKFKKGAHGAVG
jgi:hypothetical protein